VSPDDEKPNKNPPSRGSHPRSQGVATGVFLLAVPNPVTGLRPIISLPTKVDPPTVLRLPRYMQQRKIKSGLAHYWCKPTWARRGGCSIPNEALGSDFVAAVERAEVLNCELDAWRVNWRRHLRAQNV
jgi:hypothetical protein